VCRPGEGLCGGRCVSLSSSTDCGTCGLACTTGQTCIAGKCQTAATCGTGTGIRLCNGGCVDSRSDPLNCGGCGRVCGNDEVCSGGQCQGYRPAVGCTTCPCTSCGGRNCCPALPGQSTPICVDGPCP
jgi:hypothetical protein